jgi:hypothetical protein
MGPTKIGAHGAVSGMPHCLRLCFCALRYSVCPSISTWRLTLCILCEFGLCLLCARIVGSISMVLISIVSLNRGGAVRVCLWLL